MQNTKNINHDFDLTINLSNEIMLLERSAYFSNTNSAVKDEVAAIDTFGCLGCAGTFGGTFGCLGTAGCCC